jgi:hypothetical protein
MSTAELFSSIGAIATAIGALATAVTAALVYLQVQRMREAVEQSKLSDVLNACFTISDRFDKLYEVRNELLKDETDLSWAFFSEKYKTKIAILNSPEWNRLRKIAGLYELIGSLVHNKMIDARIIFDFLGIQVSLWAKAKDLTLEMRKIHIPDLWIHWEYLVKLRLDYSPYCQLPSDDALSPNQAIVDKGNANGFPLIECAQVSPSSRGNRYEKDIVAFIRSFLKS